MRLIWLEAANPPVDALVALARDVAYVGHSASLTRCAFRVEEPPVASRGRLARRRIYPGRLLELETAFGAGRRPSPGAIVVSPTPPAAESANAFSSGWIVFEIVSGSLDLRATAPACKALIKTVMSGYEASAGRDAIPAWVSGHEDDRSPASEAHLAAVPLAFAGFEHADGTLMGFALAPPHSHPDLLSESAFRKALLQVTTPGPDGRRIVKIVLGKDGVLELAMTLEAERMSLDPRRYQGPARLWATVTPMVLDRHLKGGSNEAIQEEMESLVSDACERIVGVRPVRVVAGKHAAVSGAPSAYPSGRGPRWTGWRVPKQFATRRLAHAVIDFGDMDGGDREIAGPLLVGAGRFCGLGLCLPIEARGP